MKKIFYNQPEKRLRAGWRILLFIFLFWLFASISFAIKPLLGDITKREFVEGYSIIIVFILAIGASIAVPIARRYFDKKSYTSLGLRVNKKAIQDIVFGFLLSGLMAGLFFFIAVIFGLVEFNGFNIGDTQELNGNSFDYVKFISVMSIGALLILFIEHVLVGYWEELVFRGYLFQNMVDGMGMRFAIVVSCLIYGLIHAANPNAGLISSTIIVLFGFLRIYGLLVTKMLWLSMGMHIGWNFFQGPVFGFAASGHKKATLLSINPTSYDWLSGGEFGPEGSLLIIPIVLLALVVMKWWAKKSNMELE